ncbi:MAG TPA: SDR family oxidoreductase [Rhodoblastus sp.]|nr:SDR family oxidoreductase [Rhodoblastus sp.]
MRIALITGTSQGVGLGIATVFLRQGYKVFGADQKPAPDTLASNENYAHVAGDLRDGDFCRTIVEDCAKRHGRIDTLVNNAGLGNARAFQETTDEDYDRYYDINVRPVLRLCRFALPALKQSKGSIVNIASVFGMVGAAGAAAYVPTKYAVVGITRMLATEFGRDGVRVNAVAPGLIWSPGTDERIRTNEWWHRMMIEASPLGRVGQPEEIGEACAFLASPGASFVNGAILPVDGGWAIAKFLPQPVG